MNDISRRGALAALVALPILAAISSANPAAVADSNRAACVPTAIHGGAPPKWTAAAWSDSSPGFKLPYALASHAAAAAFFWAPTLRAGHPTNPANKVLWIVRYPRNGQPLRILARSGAGPTRTVHMSFPADSSPGQIYPSYVDLPTPGCWQLTLHWDTHVASLSINVHPASATGAGSSAASARSRPPEPLPRLSGPALATPTHMFIVASNNGVSPLVVNVDRQTVHAVPGLRVPSSYTTPWGPRVELLRATAGGAVALVSRQSCQRCVLSQAEYLIGTDGSARRIATLPRIAVGATGTIETAPARGRPAIWLLRWPRAGPCSLRLIPGSAGAVHVPCGNIAAETQAGLWIGDASGEVIVNPLTGRTVARIAVSPAGVGTALYPLWATLALENSGLQPGGSLGTQFGHLRLVSLTGGDRRQLVWPSYFGNIIRVVPEPDGPLVAVDFGSPAYPGPAQAEDIWILNTTTATFTHLPGYPAQVDIKASNVVWTNDDRLVIVAHGGGRAVVAIWKPGQATLPLRTMPNRLGYNAFIPITG